LQQPRAQNFPNKILIRQNLRRFHKSPLAQKNSYSSDSGLSFLFQLDHNTKHICLNKQKETLCDKSQLMVFGGGHDLSIYSCSDQRENCYSNLGFSYRLPEGVQMESEKAKRFLAGEFLFLTVEIEVYQVLG
jgi:hypothetical protein